MSERLHVFISYSTEDRDLATAIGEELRRAFSPAILKLTIDVEFSFGANWRERLESDLSETDILLIVATGRQKASHSFTGFEVGFFTGSTKHRPKMKGFPEHDRMVIPMAIFTRTPEAVSDIQALNFEPMLIDNSALKDPKRLSSVSDQLPRNNPIFKLFKQILGIINESLKLSQEELEAFDRQLREPAARLTDLVHDELRQRVYSENFPERKIVVRTSPNAADPHRQDALSGASVEFFGRFDAFGFEIPSASVVPWADFASTIAQEEVARAWSDLLRLLVTAALRGDFSDNRQIVTSLDRARAYRMFVARSVIYYSGVREIHIYIVEIRYKDYGDPTTTMLLKAISIGLQYRFMFLEETSEFSPKSFNATLLDKLRAKIVEMTQQLDFLLWMSRDAGLSDAESLIVILGDTAPCEVDKKAMAWEEAKGKLYGAANKALATANNQELLAAKGEFLGVLQDFCGNTDALNRDFTARVLLALERIVSKSTDEHPAKAA